MIQNRLFAKELNYDNEVLQVEASSLLQSMIEEQQIVFNK